MIKFSGNKIVTTFLHPTEGTPPVKIEHETGHGRRLTMIEALRQALGAHDRTLGVITDLEVQLNGDKPIKLI